MLREKLKAAWDLWTQALVPDTATHEELEERARESLSGWVCGNCKRKNGQGLKHVDQCHYCIANDLGPPAKYPGEFMECDTCRAKPGSPTLCRGCLNNRQVIGTALTELSRYAL